MLNSGGHANPEGDASLFLTDFSKIAHGAPTVPLNQIIGLSQLVENKSQCIISYLQVHSVGFLWWREHTSLWVFST